jgi:hypothetical protein
LRTKIYICMLIWKPRCTATAASEQSIGITPKAKASKYNGPRGDWSDVYTSLMVIGGVHLIVPFLFSEWPPWAVSKRNKLRTKKNKKKTRGFTIKDKTTKYVGPKGDWTRGYSYNTRDGYCPCGASLAAHENERCPGVQKDPRAADERLLTCLLGRRRLSVMERMGRVPFISK